jgi:hypothetical protein
MGEKRVFECLWGELGQNYVDKMAIDVSINDVAGQFPEREFIERMENRRVRVTLEVLDDDHLEMEKLERE